MTPALEAEMKRLAEAYAKNNTGDKWLVRGDFVEGFRAAIEHLEKLAPEFKAEVCNAGFQVVQERLAHTCKLSIADFHEGARWQFDQDRSWTGYYRNQVEQLEANLASVEAERDEWKCKALYSLLERCEMSQAKKPREWLINPVVGYKCEVNENGIGRTGNEIHVVEYPAFQKAIAALKQARFDLKMVEQTGGLNTRAIGLIDETLLDLGEMDAPSC